jgi:Ca2+-binding RTX toxin-like protein
MKIVNNKYQSFKEKIMAIHQKKDPKTGQVIIEGDAGNDHIHVERRMVHGHEDGVIVEAEDDQGHVTQKYALSSKDVKKGGGLRIDGGKGDDDINVDENVHSNLKLYGGDDNDLIHGGSGNDEIFGDEGDDILTGGAGQDYIDGSYGNDTIYGGAGSDLISGGNGEDRLYGGAGDDTISGGADDDHLYGDSSDSYLDGGPGNDIVDR